MNKLLDLLTRQLSAASQLAQHALAIGPRFVDHVSALLLGHLNFGLGIGGCILTTTCRLDLGLFTHALRFIGRLTQQPRTAIFGAGPDLCRGLARGLQDSGGFLAE